MLKNLKRFIATYGSDQIKIHSADMDLKLRKLITCVQDPVRKTVNIQGQNAEEVKKMLEGPDYKWHRVLFTGPGHIGVLLVGDDGKLYFADGNGHGAFIHLLACSSFHVSIHRCVNNPTVVVCVRARVCGWGG